ncbi:unnamed protein product [Rotaria sp. Silwood2]|nr:unnamed protein product [Rotaria sp. Silwood2]CAF4064352.1 unnamed protein product [Rotaria sp. Silwood2]
MHGNLIDSLDDVVKNMNGLSRLQHFTFRKKSNSKKRWHDVTNSLSQQYLTIIEAVNAFRHNPKAMESSTTTSVDIHNGSLSVLYIFLLLIKKRSFL